MARNHAPLFNKYSTRLLKNAILLKPFGSIRCRQEIRSIGLGIEWLNTKGRKCYFDRKCSYVPHVPYLFFKREPSPRSYRACRRKVHLDRLECKGVVMRRVHWDRD